MMTKTTKRTECVEDNNKAPASASVTSMHYRGRCLANVRERGRTLSVNGAFQHLRGLIPTEPVDRKLSKIETLRLATSYIEHLATALATSESKSLTPCIEEDSDATTTSMTMTRTRRTICTFCLAELKKAKKQNRLAPTSTSASTTTSFAW